MHKPWYSVFYIQSSIAKIVWGIVGVVVAIIVLLFVGATEEIRMEAQTANWDGRAIEHGADLYANNCAACHGPNGRGGAGPALNSGYFFTQRLSDVGFSGSLHDYVALSVAAGRPSKAQNGQWTVEMPTWSARYGGPMRDDQVLNVTAYVLNWEEEALAQSPEEDPWISFWDTPNDMGPLGIAPVGSPASPLDEDAEPRDPGLVFTSLGCAGCHNLEEDQTDTNRGPVGPHLGNLHVNAPNRIEGMSAFDYVHQMIVEPNSFIVPGYQANIMPSGLADRMTEVELDNLVEWLLDPDRVQ